uniref:Acetyl-coenzyme A synthetase N-terminal domain-containing protein n=1 Tax=Hyaloperonospora arabidopsidis (strain Emoy2) TaxID=559515 RepID=M4B9U4_HYAAE
MANPADVDETNVYPPIQHQTKTAHVQSMAQYESMYKRSLEDPEHFWGELARENLNWLRDFDQTVTGTMDKGDVAWFLNGQTNVSVNCIDRHLTRSVRAARLRMQSCWKRRVE